MADRTGQCLGAISVTGLKLDLPAWRIEQLGETVREHARAISAELGAPADHVGASDRVVSRRALVVEQPGSLALTRRPNLTPGPGEVVALPAFCGVCGSDLELLRGEIDEAFVRYPLTLGHEWSGTIGAVGAESPDSRRAPLCRRGNHPLRALPELPRRGDQRLRFLRRARIHA